MSKEPTAFDILCDPNVIAGMRRAYEESDVGGDSPIEQGGFILWNPASAMREVARLPTSGQDSIAYPICIDGTYQGKRILGTFHTHPNTGPEWRQEPSRQDIHLSQDDPETMGPHQFVISKETIYHIDGNGLVSEMGPTAQLLGFAKDDSE
jgi:hypothetical protein